MNRIIIVFLIILSSACSKDSGTPGPPPGPANFAKGADISWVTEMEASGRKFYNSAGQEKECFDLMKSLGMNTIRLRVWVNPASTYNGNADVIAKAVRAKDRGMRIMIDFHYSDTWADPGHQEKPAAWAAQDFATLKNSVSTYTLAFLNELKSNSVIPEWVQIGNETNDGMLWPDGKASTNMANFAQLVNAGFDAVKVVYPLAKVIVHVSNGWDNSLFRWLFDGLVNNGGRFDVIGMSLYPSPANWQAVNAQCLVNMNDMVVRYGKEVMVVEVGMSWDKPSECGSFLSDLVTKTKSVTNGKGLGVLYWEPQAYNNWNGYTLGAFDNSGKPTTALSVFAN